MQHQNTKSPKTFIAAAIIAGTSLMSLPLTAQAVDPGLQGYVGGGIGYYRVEDNDFEVDDNNESYKLFAGMEINETFGIQAQYIDFLESKGNAGELDISGIALGATLGIPFTPVFSAYVKGGLLIWQKDFKSNGSVPLLSANREEDGEDAFYGLGTKISLVPDAFSLRVEYERFKIDNTDIDVGSVSAEFSF